MIYLGIVAVITCSTQPYTAYAEAPIKLIVPKAKSTAQKQAKLTDTPKTPSGLTAFAGDEIIRLSWEKSSNAILYKIYLAAEPGVTTKNYSKLSQGATLVSFEPHYLVTDLQKDTTYYFVVTAENSAGASLQSAEITATTKPLFDKVKKHAVIPASPKKVRTSSTKNEIIVKWEPVKNADRYNIYLANEAGVGKRKFKQLKNGMAVYNVKHPFVYKSRDINAQFHFVVTAENQAGESLTSSEVVARLTNPLPRPTVPTKLIANVENNIVQLKWNKVKNAKKFKIHFATKPGIAAKNKHAGYKTITTRKNPYSFTQLKKNTPYYFAISALNASGESRVSKEIKVVLKEKPITPKPPPKILASNHNSDVIISWLKSNNASAYNIYMATEPGISKNNYASLSNGVVYQSVKSPFRISKLRPDQNYYIMVTALNNVGESTATDIVSIKPRNTLASLNTRNQSPFLKSYLNKIDIKPKASSEMPAKVAPLPGSRKSIRKSNLYFTLNRYGKPNPDQSKTFEQQPWSCVQSISTGLIWEIKSKDGGLRDSKNTYTWFNPDIYINGGYAGKANGGRCTNSQCDTDAYVREVNKAKLCGFDDWRLPTRAELTTIIDPKNPHPHPTIDMQSFPNAPAGMYWSQTPLDYNSAAAWFVTFDSGLDLYSKKSEAAHIRLVRGYPKAISKILKP